MPDLSNINRRHVVTACGALAGLGLILCVYLALKPGSPAGDPSLAEVNRQAAKRDVDGLKRSAESSDMKVAARAVQAYASVSGPSGAPAMQRFMADPRPAVRAEAAGGWAYVGSRNNVQPLTQLIANDPSPQVRISGLQAIDTLKAWDGLGAVLDRMADDADPTVRRAAMNTFEQVAFIRVGKKYNPDHPIQTRRAAVVPLREFVNRPVARQLYAEWSNKSNEAGK